MSATAQVYMSTERGRVARPPEVVNVTVATDERLLLSVVEAARRLGIGRTLMYELLNSGQVPSVHVGRLRKVATTALETFVNRLSERDAGDASPHPRGATIPVS